MLDLYGIIIGTRYALIHSRVYSLQRSTELHKIALAAGIPSRQTLLSLGEYMSYDTPHTVPRPLDAFGYSHPQNLLPKHGHRMSTEHIVYSDAMCVDCIVWLSGLVVSALGIRIPGRATIPLGSNLGQVVYTHCLPSFSAPRNWGTQWNSGATRDTNYGD